MCPSPEGAIFGTQFCHKLLSIAPFRHSFFEHAGELVRCLDAWCPPEDWLYLCYPSRRNMSAGLRALIDAVKA